MMKREIKYTICNPVVFAEVMENPEICKKLLERILPDKKISQLKFICTDEDDFFNEVDSTISAMKPQTEKTISIGLEAKSIRLDVLFEGEKEWYDIEMQVHNVDHPPKRSRYYHAVKTVSSLKKGELYGTLRPGYVIFICMFDYFDKKRPVYHFCMWDEKNSLPLNDGQVTIFLNGVCSEDIPEELKAFYHYLQTGKVDETDDMVQLMNQAVIEANRREEVRYKVTLYDEAQRLNTLLEMARAELAEEQAKVAAEQAKVAEEQAKTAEQEAKAAAAVRLNKLTVWLIERNRTEEILKAMNDEKYRMKLLEEAGL